MKIRFYHWWVYKLYYWVWSPIYESNPHLLKQVVKHQNAWLTDREEHYKNVRTTFRVIE